MNKQIVPIVFAFDKNLVFPASVSIFSLLTHAKESTFYDIYILYPASDAFDRTLLESVVSKFPNCKIQYREVGNCFDSAFEIRGITTPAYYRLLIPELLPEYDKVIYADADIIFRMDMSELYAMDLADCYLAATLDLGMNLSEDGVKHISTLAPVKTGEYLQSGFIMMNSDKIRKDNLVDTFKDLAKRKFKFQDQDILNIACHGKVHYLSPCYNMTDYSFYFGMRECSKFLNLYSEDELSFGIQTGNLHYNGHKPWKEYSVNFDIWWEHYRKSPIFDQKKYFDFFYSKLFELDSLSLWKRIKILLRYFLIRN